MEQERSILGQSTEIAATAASSLVGYVIGGPIGAVAGSTMYPSGKLVYDIMMRWTKRRQLRTSGIVENAFKKSGKSDEAILEDLLNNPEWADQFIALVRKIADSNSGLDEITVELLGRLIKSENADERSRYIVLYQSIEGMNTVQLKIIQSIFEADGVQASSELAISVGVPELELRNAVRDLELRGMIIDNNSEPTIWKLRELGLAVAKTLKILEEE